MNQQEAAFEKTEGRFEPLETQYKLLEKFEEEKVAKKGKKFKSDAMDAEQQQQRQERKK